MVLQYRKLHLPNALFATHEQEAVTSVAVQYPLQLALAYLFLAGYLVRTLFVSVGLPASVGVILTGFVFSFFFQAEVLAARDNLQELSFFLVLLTAGLEIRLRDLRLYIFVMAFLPAACEVLAIACFCMLVRNYTAIEGLVCGAVLVAIGDGLVIPKMKEFGLRFEGHPMPRLVFIWAPLEASFALALFGILTGFAAPANLPAIRVGICFAANVIRIVATVCMGALLGSASGWLISRRTRLKLWGNQVFTGAPVEAFLMILAVALAGFGMGSEAKGQSMVPLGFSSGGSFFQPELMVISTGIFFAAVADDEVLHEVEGIMGGVWIFGQLVLFSMLGSRTTFDIFPPFLTDVLPVMLFGLIFRFLGIFFSINLALLMRFSGHPFQRTTVMADTLFCFLSTVPRATIQGALGQVPVIQCFFRHHQHQLRAQQFIFTASRLYVVFMSIFGMTTLNFFGPRLCAMTINRPPWDEDQAAGGKAPKVVEEPEAPALAQDAKPQQPRPSEEAVVRAFAEAYDVDSDVLLGILRRAAVQAKQGAFDEEEEFKPTPPRPLGAPMRMHSEPRLSPVRMGSSLMELGGRRLYLQPSVPRDRRDLDMAQFDCTGTVLSVMAGGPRPSSWMQRQTSA